MTNYTPATVRNMTPEEIRRLNIQTPEAFSILCAELDAAEENEREALAAAENLEDEATRLTMQHSELQTIATGHAVECCDLIEHILAELEETDEGADAETVARAEDLLTRLVNCDQYGREIYHAEYAR